MEIKSLASYPADLVEQLLSPIAFYKDVKSSDPYQFDLLMQNSRIVHCDPGQVVLTKGERDSWLYFLLKGQLTVHGGDYTPGQEPINYITPGEVFGDIAMLSRKERSATVVADPKSRNTILFGTNFSAFGALTDYSKLSLLTKLRFYRNTLHGLRWKLELYSSKFSDSELSMLHRKVKLHVGVKDTEEELLALDKQGQALADILLRWNTEVSGSDAELEAKTTLPDEVAEVIESL